MESPAREAAGLALVRAMQEATQVEQEAAMLLLKQADTPERSAAVALLLVAGRRRRQRTASDSRTDGERRKTMPARIAISLAEKYEAAADRRHMSTYAWVCEALAEKYRREGGGASAPPKAHRPRHYAGARGLPPRGHQAPGRKRKRRHGQTKKKFC